DRAAAQTPSTSCRTAIITAREQSLDGEPPIAGVTRQPAMINSCAILTLYSLTPKLTSKGPRLPQKSFAPVFYARLVENGSGSANWVEQVRWADARSCPALAQAVKSMNELAPKFGGAAPPRGGGGSYTMDGVGYNFWAKGLAPPFEKRDYKYSL